MPYPWRPVLIGNPPQTQLILDTLSASARSVWWVAERLRVGYTGALCQVRRASDNVLADIGYNLADNKLNQTALAAHCGASNGFVRTIYDQSGGGRTLVNATNAQQPKIYDGGTTTAVKIGNSVAFDCDGVNDGFNRADSLGLSGGAALSYWTVLDLDTNTTNGFMGLGATATGDDCLWLVPFTNTTLGVTMIGAERVFNITDITTGTHQLLSRLAAGAQISTARLRQNGADCTQNSLLNGTTVLNLNNSSTFLGREVAAFPADGKFLGGIVWNADLTAADVTKMDAHVWT